MCTFAARAQGQDAAPPPAHISFVDGSATVQHEGELVAAVVNMPIVEGDRLRTADGRVEVMFPDGSAIEIDSYSEVEFLSAMRVRVLAGTIEHRPARAPYAASGSGRYLPPDLQYYGSSLDQYGSWQYEPPYGYVWFPSVAVDWRPYYYGYWSPFRRYGWTWIGFDVWSWPTHHYGRWGFGHSRWFWIPGRTWAPAWVSWGAAPGYVSWCPLGFDSRPVFALSSFGYGDTWRGWTVVRRDEFAVHGRPVPRVAIDGARLRTDTPFIVQRVAPLSATATVTHGAAAGMAVPRYQSPSPAAASPRLNGVDQERATRSTAPGGVPGTRFGRGGVQAPSAQVLPHEAAGSSSPITSPARSSAPAPPSVGSSRSPVIVPPHARTTYDYRPSAQDYRAPTRDYRPPTRDYRPPMPSEAYRPPPVRDIAPGGSAVPRYAPPASATPHYSPPPPSAAPHASPPPASAAPRYSAPSAPSPPPARSSSPHAEGGSRGAQAGPSGSGHAAGTAVRRQD